MSNILTNNINPRSGNKITIGGVNDTVSIAGTVTYEDVTSVDSIGIITARGGLDVGVGGTVLTTTTSGNIGIGTDNPVGSLEVRDSKANLIVAKDGLTVKSNSDLHTTYDTLQIGAGGALLSYSTATVTADTQFVHNAYRSSGGTFKYRYADTAARIRMNSPGGEIIFDNAASGSADADITFSERLRINSAGALSIGIGTESTSAANLVEMYVGATDESYATIRGKYNRSNEYNRSEVRFGVENNASGLGFLAFATGNNSATERLRITSSGNVGIGTITPRRSFHLDDSSSPIILVSGNAPNVRLTDLGVDDNDNNRVMFGLATADDHFFPTCGAGDGVLRGQASGNLCFGHGQVERFRLNQSGNIGIGVTDNIDAKVTTLTSGGWVTEEYVGSSYINYTYAKAVGKSYVRGASSERNIDIGTLTGESGNQHCSIHVKMYAVGATSNNSAIIEFTASARASGGSHASKTVSTPSKTNVYGNGINQGTASWVGGGNLQTLRYVTSTVSYTRYVLEVTCWGHDYSTFRIT